MSENNSVFEKIEIRSHSGYVVVNEKVGMSVIVVPAPGLDENEKIVRRKDVAEFWFVKGIHPEDVPEQNWDWPYIITVDDLGEIDMSSEDYIEEVFGKYGNKFLQIDKIEAVDNFDRYKEVIGKVFPDIEEKRKLEDRRG